MRPRSGLVRATQSDHATILLRRRLEWNPDADNALVEFQIEIGVILVPRLFASSRRFDHRHLLEQLGRRAAQRRANQLKQPGMIGDRVQRGVCIEKAHQFTHIARAFRRRQVGQRVRLLAERERITQAAAGRAMITCRIEAQPISNVAFVPNRFTPRRIIPRHRGETGAGSVDFSATEHVANQNDAVISVALASGVRFGHGVGDRCQCVARIVKAGAVGFDHRLVEHLDVRCWRQHETLPTVGPTAGRSDGTRLLHRNRTRPATVKICRLDADQVRFKSRSRSMPGAAGAHVELRPSQTPPLAEQRVTWRSRSDCQSKRAPSTTDSSAAAIIFDRVWIMMCNAFGTCHAMPATPRRMATRSPHRCRGRWRGRGNLPPSCRSR